MLTSDKASADKFILLQVVEVYMDGQKVDLPNFESVVVLNIPNWGAGVKPWTLGNGHLNFPPSSYNDTKLEVFCVYSSFHIAQMQVSFFGCSTLGWLTHSEGLVGTIQDAGFLNRTESLNC